MSLIQLHDKLFFCQNKIKASPQFQPSIFSSIDFYGIMYKLQPIKRSRTFLSMCAISSFILTIGGLASEDITSSCEKYMIGSDKWKDFPPLRAARYSPGSIILESNKVFCFCGVGVIQSMINCVEMNQIASDSEWKTLPTNQSIRSVIIQAL